MGAEHSSGSSKQYEREREKYSKEEVNRMLEHQRVLFDKRFKELMSQNHNTAFAQKTAREEARKEVDRIIQEKLKNSQNIQTSNSNPSPSFPPQRPSPPTNFPLERNSAPYSFTGHELKSGLASPSTSSANLYPDLNKETSNSPAEPNSARFSPSAPPAPRDRSLSRNRNRARPSSSVRNANEDEELNCPTCKNRYTLPIFQCKRGHSSCLHCKNSMACCGICRLPITDMRNITLEAYIGERKIICQNSDDGCSLSFKLADMKNHLKECPYREMQCPLKEIFGQCQWRGKLPQMVAHFDDVHQMHRQGNVDTEMRLLNITSDNQIVYFVVIGTFNFLFHIKVSERDGMMYMAVQLLGTQHSASKWSYEIHFYNKAEPRRKFEYSDICNSINTPINSIIAESKCAAIPLSYANTFVNNASVLYKFYIRKNVEGRNKNFGNNHRGRGARRRN